MDVGSYYVLSFEPVGCDADIDVGWFSWMSYLLLAFPIIIIYLCAIED